MRDHLDTARLREENPARLLWLLRVTPVFGITNFAPFLIPAFIGFYLLWKLWTAPSEPARDSTTIQYEPPENLTPGECGALLEDVVEVRLITATIVDLSVKGYLTIDNTNAAN